MHRINQNSFVSSNPFSGFDTMPDEDQDSDDLTKKIENFKSIKELQEIINEIKENIESFKSQRIVELACTFDNRRENLPENQFTDFEKETKDLLISLLMKLKSTDLKIQELVKAAYSFRKCSTEAEIPFWKNACKRLLTPDLKELKHLKAEEIAKLACAFTCAEQRVSCFDLFEKLSLQVEKKANEFSATDISHTIWAYGYEKKKPRNTIPIQKTAKQNPDKKDEDSRKVESDSGKEEQEVNRQHQVKMLKDFFPKKTTNNWQNQTYEKPKRDWETIHEVNERILSSLKDQAESKVKDFTQKEFTKITSVLTNLHCSDKITKQFQDLLDSTLRELIKKSDPKAMANFAKNLSSDKERNPETWELFKDSVKLHMMKYPSTELVYVTYWLLAAYCTSSDEHTWVLIEQLLERIIQLDGAMRIDVFTKESESKENLPEKKSWANGELLLINTIYKVYDLEKVSKNKKLVLSISLKDDIEKSLKSLNINREKNLDEQTKLQSAMTKIMKSKKPEGLEEEYQFESFFFDIAYPDEKIAIEIDGPFHSAWDNQVKDQIKNKICELSNWHLIRINCADWDARKTQDEIKQYCLEKIKDILPQLKLV